MPTTKSVTNECCCPSCEGLAPSGCVLSLVAADKVDQFESKCGEEGDECSGSTGVFFKIAAVWGENGAVSAVGWYCVGCDKCTSDAGGQSGVCVSAECIGNSGDECPSGCYVKCRGQGAFHGPEPPRLPCSGQVCGGSGGVYGMKCFEFGTASCGENSCCSQGNCAEASFPNCVIEDCIPQTCYTGGIMTVQGGPGADVPCEGGVAPPNSSLLCQRVCIIVPVCCPDYGCYGGCTYDEDGNIENIGC